MDMYEKIAKHDLHEIEVAVYAEGVNVAIECLTCSEVIIDADRGEA